MNELLLSNFNNNENLSELLLNYQEYFNFVKNENNSVSLYLNTFKLKEYLVQGKDIKYRKFIFIFLENIYQQKKNKNYQFYISDKNNANIINKNLSKQDIENIHKLINIKKYLQNNSIQLKNRNIVYLKNDIYIHLKNKCFMKKEYIHDLKIKINPKGFIINNNNVVKNIIYMINILNNKSYSKKKENHGLKETKCNLIITHKIKMHIWLKLIQDLLPNSNIIQLNSNDKLQEYTNNNIMNCDFVLMNSNLFFNQFKINELKYNLSYQNDNMNDQHFKTFMNNCIYEELMNENFEENIFKNIYCFSWLNIIIDDIEKFQKYEYKYTNFLKIDHYNYILSEKNIESQDYKNISHLIIDKNILDEHSFSNFEYLIKNDLLIKNNTEINNDNEIINIIEHNEQEELIQQIQFNKYNEKDISLLLLQSINDFFYQNKESNLKTEILNEQKSENIIQHTRKNNFIDEIMNNYQNQYFCCICMERIEKNNMCLLGCCHYFCKNCIIMHKVNEQLNYKSSKCPMCRYEYNCIYNLCDSNIKLSKSMQLLEDILNNENKNNQKILIINDFNECLSYIQDKFKDKFEMNYYKKNNKKKIQLIKTNYLLKQCIKDVNIYIYIQFKDNQEEFNKIKNICEAFSNDVKKTKFYLIQYDPLKKC
jgi:hypothetical protein